MSKFVPWEKRSPENAAARRKANNEGKARRRLENGDEQRESARQYRTKNWDVIIERERQYRMDNKEKVIEWARQHRERYKEYYDDQRKQDRVRRVANSKRHYHENKEEYIARSRARQRYLNRSALSRRYASEIEEFYRTARKLTEETGVLHVVDHIWPINGKDSCGLHVPWNLRVITQVENDSKGNKRPEDSPSSVLNMEMNDAQGSICLHDL
jgi:5-methylcytosine-specific restriction endonuclease McrA